MTGWSVSDAFADTPVIAAEGGFTGQGYTCGYTILTQLAADKPVDLARVQTLYDDTGAKGEAGQSISGRLPHIARGRRSEAGRVGKEWVKTFHYRWEPHT